ncbi:MAG: TlpA family protein disulfide reductase [Proteobacteria bacterium]|nr:TlpA family protein disulfide reductase [Pseudomonadota bacterium]
MRFIKIAAVLLILAPALSTGTELVPDWRLTTADGGSVRLSQEVQEQPVILFFWATWCPYCKALMPHLQSIKLELGDDVEILAINFRDKGDPVAFVEAAGYDFIVLADGDDVAELYGIHGTPGVLIVDRDQVLRFDLRALPQREIPSNADALSHAKKAAYRAPYWAAEIRRSLDLVLEGAAD